MKHLALLACMIILLTFKVAAQHVPVVEPDPKALGKNIELKDLAAHVGELVNLCDTVHRYTVAGDSLVLFCMGGRYPHQLLTIVAKDPGAVFSAYNNIGDAMCVYGTIGLRNGKFVMIVSGISCMLFYSYPKIH